MLNNIVGWFRHSTYCLLMKFVSLFCYGLFIYCVVCELAYVLSHSLCVLNVWFNYISKLQRHAGSRQKSLDFVLSCLNVEHEYWSKWVRSIIDVCRSISMQFSAEFLYDEMVMLTVCKLQNCVIWINHKCR